MSKRIIALSIFCLAFFALTRTAAAETYRIEFIDGGDRPPGLPMSRLWYKNMALITPNMLVICQGDSVEFVNNFVGQVNVFSYSNTLRFDLGRFPPGESRTAGPFPKPGLVRIYSEIHSHIKGAILVVDCDPKDRTRALDQGLKDLQNQLDESDDRAYFEQMERIAADRKKQLRPPPRPPDQKENQRSDFPVKTEKARGLYKVTFETPYGRVISRLPDDMSLGEEIAGTDQRAPAGETPATQAQNLQQLNKYSVEAQGMKSLAVRPISETMTRHLWSIPAQTTTVAMSLMLGGRILAHIELPPPKSPPLPPTLPPIVPCPLKPLPGDLQPPITGQPRQPIEIYGPIGSLWRLVRELLQPSPDPDEMIRIKINDEHLAFLAASPRKYIVESPANIIGPAEMELKVGDVETKAPFRNIAVRLTATKTLLKTNETAVVHGELSGLEGAQRDIQLQLETTGAVTMEGGNSQVLTAHPTQIETGGRFTFERKITADQPGSFEVTVVAQDECGKISKTCQHLADELSRLAYQTKGAPQAKLTEIGPNFDSLFNAYTNCLRLRSECAGEKQSPGSPNVFYNEGDIALDICEAQLRAQLLMAQAYLAASMDFVGQSFWRDQIERIQKKLKECEEKKAKQKAEEEAKKKPEAPGTTPPGAPPSGGPQTKPSPQSQPSPQPPPSPTPQPTPSPTPVPEATPAGTPGDTKLKGSNRPTAAELEGQTVHIEGSPLGGVKGLWLIKIKLQSGATMEVFIQSDQKPDLKFCNWIKVGKAHEGATKIVVESYEKTEDPNKKPPTGPKPGDKTEPPKESPTPTPEAPPAPPQAQPPTPPGDTVARECDPEGATKTETRTVVSCALSDAVVTKYGISPTGEILVNIFGAIMKIAGAGRGVTLGEKVAGAFSTSAARHIYVKVKKTVTTYKDLYVCKNGKWVLKGPAGDPTSETSESGWIKLMNPTGGVDYWLAGDPASDVDAAADTAKKSFGCP